MHANEERSVSFHHTIPHYHETQKHNDEIQTSILWKCGGAFSSAFSSSKSSIISLLSNCALHTSSMSASSEPTIINLKFVFSSSADSRNSSVAGLPANGNEIRTIIFLLFFSNAVCATVRWCAWCDLCISNLAISAARVVHLWGEQFRVWARPPSLDRSNRLLDTLCHSISQ